MFKPGSIRKIEVKNFVTYAHTEFYPGPNLNMILGPNGTGKSTMVAAIILGLGGNPKTVGRGSKISEYVKYNCEEAEIHIHLQTNKEHNFLHIMRKFDTRDKSTWKVNNEKVTLQEMLGKIKKYNIQVDNLCQFLPQDRVQDFAKLNKLDLLKETQIALCKQDLMDKQQALIDLRVKHKELSGQLSKFEKKLEEAKTANTHLEGRVKNISVKKKYDEEIQAIDRKLSWLQYEDKREQLTVKKKERDKMVQKFEEYKKAAWPIEEKIQESKNKIKQIQSHNVKVVQEVQSVENAIKASNNKMQALKLSINEVRNDMEFKLAEQETLKKEIEETTKKFESLKLVQQRLENELLAETDNEKEIAKKLESFKSLQKNFQDKLAENEPKKQNAFAQIRACDHEIARIEDVKNQRLKLLERIAPDAFQAVMWLRNNRHLFRAPVFEPIMLEVNVLDPKHAVYVERSIGMKDRIAFTCVDKDDMNELIKRLRIEQKLTINVVCSNGDLSQIHPHIPIEQLRKFGFYSYVHSLFTAPDPIMYYLCRTYNLHNIPVGTSVTDSCYQGVPRKFTNFFSEKYRYSIKYSKYNNDKTVRQNAIKSDGGFSVILNETKLRTMQAKKSEMEGIIIECDRSITEIKGQVRKFEEKMEDLKGALKVVQVKKQELQSANRLLEALQTKKEGIQKKVKSVEKIKQDGQEKIMKIIESIKTIQGTSYEYFKKLQPLLLKQNLNVLKIEVRRKELSQLEEDMKEVRLMCNEAEKLVKKVKEEYSDLLTEAKSLLVKAKAKSNGFTPDDEGFQEFRDSYEALPQDPEKLFAVKNQILCKMDCLNTANADELREYNERDKLIRKLGSDIESGGLEIEKIDESMKRLKVEWLNPLEQLVGKINEKFSAAFERMGCAGEVSISKNGGELDFDQYGLSIKVTYRASEPLQELNNTVQSGGERAVATAAFMLSLQELTPVPFRCVDEINQGMDETNERRIFELLVDTTNQENTSQYFLITPKLVPDLRFSESMMIHFVHNGPFIDPDKKWSFSRICNPQGVKI